mmetsp:Transcript_4699/g.6966  ORF Transcript_4699/g.6966 Transcript_4699/m.6966 type:complete len:432 (-) Transcript_4699:1635-2930(-)|eukprot:CAMPEP_0172426904 /NCGR_PEP_ID=MMETSP1064-20121228/39562_1 /TAXON_ID=202472 /ORGANISM="Aulacoseira subarctica , Strain CCAP 1002/5" /LENGTH=431 /DNA_ID=CAMNT_0013170773 /DNA_START=24 /DNA_END=1319 /DNA_ORIENTATION=-
MAPPPTQAGKFKPRKPAQKKPSTAITPGVSSSIFPEPPSTQQSHESRSTSGRGRGRSGGREGSGRGRGGSAGRMPIPQGRVFFTGEAAQTVTASNTPSRKTSGGGIKPYSSQQQEGEELIVGEVSEGVGAAALSRAAAGGSSRKTFDEDGDQWDRPSYFDRDEMIETNNLPSNFYTYESSSDEDGPIKKHQQAPIQQRGGRHKLLTMMPTCLHPDTDDKVRESELKQEEKKASHFEENSSEINLISKEDPPMISPFVDYIDSNGTDSNPLWMLFKFPTRLPRIHPRCTATHGGAKHELTEFKADTPLSIGSTVLDGVLSMEVNNEEHFESTANKGPSSANTSASYDDTLKDVVPGQYGKIIVYKSGKTLLVIGPDSDPKKQVSMLLMEGIRPSFYQQVVAIDPSGQTFTPLGEVRQTSVVIPDVDGAFAAT